MHVSDFHKHYSATISIAFIKITLYASENQALTDIQKPRQLQSMSDLKNFDLNYEDRLWIEKNK